MGPPIVTFKGHTGNFNEEKLYQTSGQSSNFVTLNIRMTWMWECLLLISNSRRKNQRRDIFYFVVFGVSKEIEINKKRTEKVERGLLGQQ